MKTYVCEEMMCDGCVSRINKGLDQEGIAHRVNLDTKTVVIEKDEDCEKAVETLDDRGVTAVEK